ncbi:MAG: hypothetical protein ACJAWV_000240 [Flammeovirgaceae bacterium]|jgi:hypothetical protein
MSKILNAIRKNLPDSLIWEGDTLQEIRLVEEDSCAKCKLVVLKKQKSDNVTLTINSDYKKEKGGLGDIFEQLKIECESNSKCDYIIFCETPKKTIALLIDLKSGGKTDWEQITQGRLIAEHCLEKVAQQLGENTFENTEFRAVVFATENANQMTSRVNRQRKYSIPWEGIIHGIKHARMDCNPRNPYKLKMFVS